MPRPSAALFAFAFAVIISVHRSNIVRLRRAFAIDGAIHTSWDVSMSAVGSGTAMDGWGKTNNDAPPLVLAPSNASLRTVALIEPLLRGGFRNQAMRFTAFVMHAVEASIPQILLPSIRFGDKYGTEKPIPFEDLFDVEEWNRHAIGGSVVGPEGVRLPRMVPYDTAQHYHWNESYLSDRTALSNPYPRTGGVTQFSVPVQNATHPLAHGGGTMTGWLWLEYGQYVARRKAGGDAQTAKRSPVEVLVFRALQPSAKLRSAMGRGGQLPESVQRGDFVCVHTRVEVDMQEHFRCSDKSRTGYVRELSAIFAAVEEVMPTPPASEAFLPLNYVTMGNDTSQVNPTWRDIAQRNLRALDEALTKGLWNGRVRAFTLGSAILNGDPRFDGMRSTAGSVINFFLAVEAKVFVGQRASTWSIDVAAIRYHYFGLNASTYLFSKNGLEKLEGDPAPHSCDVAT